MPRLPNPKRIANAQKRDLDPLLAQTDQRIRATFAQQRAQAMPTLDAFAQAYKAEYDRLNADLDEDEDPKNVPLHWLTSSGWKRKVEDALAHAAQQASTQCATFVTQAHDQAVRLGNQHGRELVKAAMQPAVNAAVRAYKRNPKKLKARKA